MWCRAQVDILTSDSALDAALAQVGAPTPCDDSRVHGIVRREDASGAVGDVDDWTKVRLFHPVLAHELDAGVAHLLAREMRFDHDELAGVKKTLDVFAQPEDRRDSALPLVGADPLEGAEAVVEGMGKDVDLGVIPIDKLTLKPDLLFLLNHGTPWNGHLPAGGGPISGRPVNRATGIPRRAVSAPRARAGNFSAAEVIGRCRESGNIPGGATLT